MRVGGSLEQLDPAPVLLADVPDTYDGAPALAASPDGWMLAWNNGAEGNTGNIRVRRIAANGTPAGDLSGTVIGSGNSERPAITFDGARYAVAWRDPDEVHLSYVTPAGVPTAPRLVHTAEDQTSASVAIATINRGVAAVVYTHVSWAPEHAGVSRVFLQNVTQGMKSRTVR
jgi:hypothetical protein